MRSSHYPRWSVYLAGSGAFIFLASLFALMLVPAEEPASLLEQVLWVALLVAFLALLPLFFLRLKDMVIRLSESPGEDDARSRRQDPTAARDQAGRGREKDD